MNELYVNIESGNAVSPSIVIAELSAKYSRENADFYDKFNFIKLNSRIISLDFRQHNPCNSRDF